MQPGRQTPSMRRALLLFLLLLPLLSCPSSSEETVDFDGEEDGAGDNCMALRDCEPLMYLFNAVRRGDLPEGFTRRQVVATLREAQCRGSSAQVRSSRVRRFWRVVGDRLSVRRRRCSWTAP